MEKTRRSLEETTIEDIATIINHSKDIASQKAPIEALNSEGSKKLLSIPTQQELIKGLYHSCIALEKDNQYLYVLLARAEHKLRWHEDRETKQSLERGILKNALKKANETIRTLSDLVTSMRNSPSPKRN